MTATTTPITTTTQRSVAGLIRPASRPPNAPPISAPTAITSAAGHTTFPENTKKIAAAMLTLNAMACFSGVQPRQRVFQHEAKHGQHDHAQPRAEIAAVDCGQADRQHRPFLGCCR